MAAVEKDKELSKKLAQSIGFDNISLPRKETDVTYELHQPLDTFLVHKIVDHVKYDELRRFAQFRLRIEESDYDSIIARETSPNKQIQAVSKTVRL